MNRQGTNNNEIKTHNSRRLFKKRLRADDIFQLVVTVVCIFIFLIIAYPLYFVIIASFSDPTLVSTGKVVLWPKGISFQGYEMIFNHSKLWTGYRNAVFYTIAGTLFNLLVTLPAAYAASRKEFMPRRVIMFLFAFTMYFGGGLIPTYLLISDLKLNNTIWVFIIPFALNVYNFIITRTFFETSIAEEMRESAILDGCNDFRFFISVALPLSKAIISVIALYYAVGHWNDYFTSLIYIRNQELIHLQMVLREILLVADSSSLASSTGGYGYALKYVESMRYGVIIVASLPLMIIYPFIQKYFEKGVMLGAVKG